MKVLVIGGGGREHALIWKLADSPMIKELYCAPGNAGTARHAQNVDISAKDLQGLLKFALDNRIDFTVVGMDEPLALGVVDLFREHNLSIFGPTQSAAMIESSKVFSKNLMQKYNIPTAQYASFDNVSDASDYLEKCKYPLVIKTDGLALGKGVFICGSAVQAQDALTRMMVFGEFGESGESVVIEEYLTGREISVFAFCDGKSILPFASARDYKRAQDGNRGPNTGGMGSISPCPYYTTGMHEACMESIYLPTMAAMTAEGRPYTGILYFGLMETPDGVKVLEYNARFGDPETQAVLPRLKSDLLPILMACANGTLESVSLQMSESAAACVIMASSGYPEQYETGFAITIPEQLPEDILVFHAGTRQKDELVLSSGGRVLGVTGLGSDVPDAVSKAYQSVENIKFANSFCRSDIGYGG